MTKVDETIEQLRANVNNVRCAELCSMLDDLGFRIRNAGGAHKVVSHPDLKGFRGTDFDCGHGRNPTVKPVYIKKNVIRVLENWKAELEAING